MKKIPIILIGAGGHAASCIDVLLAEGKYEIAGLIGLADEVGSSELGIPVIGTDDDLPQIRKTISHAHIALGQILRSEPREASFKQLQEFGFELPSIKSPTAIISPESHIGAGTIVMHGALVNRFASIGDNCIINSMALIEHGTVIGSHTHVSTRATINGDSIVGDRCFLGSGSTIGNGVTIGDGTIVGMGISIRSNKVANSKVLKND
jgi:sugar O-acyltransferase (sialic acid O-acetyltransferase NeuD family)